MTRQKRYDLPLRSPTSIFFESRFWMYLPRCWFSNLATSPSNILDTLLYHPAADNRKRVLLLLWLNHLKGTRDDDDGSCTSHTVNTIEITYKDYTSKLQTQL